MSSSARCGGRNRSVGALIRRVHRRIEKHRVLADEASPRVVHFDEQCDERLGDRVCGLQLDDFATVRGALRAHRDGIEEDRPVDPLAHERIVRGELNLETRQLLRARIQIDLGIERRVERREKTDIPETERERR